jgi:monofunctional biosynthetic peptidoglycan transglycosylase
VSFGRIIRILAVALAILLAVPLVLSVLYRFVDPPSTLMLADWARGRTVTRQWVPIERVAPIAVRSVAVSEDSRFCVHHGLDFEAIDEAVDRAGRRGRPVGGVSTITMQVAKNLFLWPQRSYLRKALEAPLALWLDLVLPKRRIMEIYLNVAEWGPSTYGIEAGARRAFGKPAAALGPQEAALMATALPNPILRDPKAPSARQRVLARIIQRRAANPDPPLPCLG